MGSRVKNINYIGCFMHNWISLLVHETHIWHCSKCGGCDYLTATPSKGAKINNRGLVYRRDNSRDGIKLSCEEYLVYGIVDA